MAKLFQASSNFIESRKATAVTSLCPAAPVLRRVRSVSERRWAGSEAGVMESRPGRAPVPREAQGCSSVFGDAVRTRAGSGCDGHMRSGSTSPLTPVFCPIHCSSLTGQPDLSVAAPPVSVLWTSLLCVDSMAAVRKNSESGPSKGRRRRQCTLTRQFDLFYF